MAAEGWERSDFPIVCETCLGDNPYVRMTRAETDKECKVCARPFTVFRWRAGTQGRFKKTEVCQTCAKLKNVCQTCLLDLTFNLPVQVRDAAMPEGSVDTRPESGIHREYFSRINEQKVADGDLPYAAAQYNPLVAKLARATPKYDRNRAHICSFFVKGNCNRGETCPFRHEMPDPEQPEDLAKQNLKDRYYGVNDPVAKRMLNKVKEHPANQVPDTDVKTLFVANVEPGRITEQDLRDQFYYFGEITSIKMMAAQKCAFIEYTTHEAAAAAVAKNSKLIVKGSFLRVSWAKPVQKKPEGAAAITSAPAVVPLGMGPSSYPSMNPERIGARPEPVAAPAAPGAVAALPAPNWNATAYGADGGQPAKRQRTQE